MPSWLRSQIVLGLWPIAGVTTIGVTPEDACETIDAALKGGIRAFDTAFSYGLDGQSDRALGDALRRNGSWLHRDDVSIISKVSQRYDASGKRYVDGRPETLIQDAETCLKRIGIEKFDVLMLHSVDESLDLRRSGDALHSLRKRGLADHVGICNASDTQRVLFESTGPSVAIQCPLNLLQTDSLDSLIHPAANNGTVALTYWALMKGLLAGGIKRDHIFPAGDSRPTYPIFQGDAREHAHRVVDRLRVIGQQYQRSVANLAVSWVLSQYGVAGVLIGARYAQQVHDFADAAPLDDDLLEMVTNAAMT
ncbi:MAG: aldo/keto reductase [Planctomycetota bacterium]